MELRHALNGKRLLKRAVEPAHPLQEPRSPVTPALGDCFDAGGVHEGLDRDANRRKPMPYDDFLEALRNGCNT